MIKGHLLIDVHDYSHVQNGPGILLVAHEGNFSMDETTGQLGLVSTANEPVADPLKAAFEAARTACRLLESEPKLKGIKLHTNEFLVFSNDRLLAPNTAEARQQFEPVIKRAFGKAAVTLAPQSADPRERLAFMRESKTGVRPFDGRPHSWTGETPVSHYCPCNPCHPWINSWL